MKQTDFFQDEQKLLYIDIAPMSKVRLKVRINWTIL